jgi:hypothetical protein
VAGRAGICGNFATLAKFLCAVTVPVGFWVVMSRAEHTGGGVMGIDSLILILLLTFGAAYVLNRIGSGRRTRRVG